MATRKKGVRQLRQETKERQDRRNAKLKEQGIKTVKIEVSEQDIQCLTESTGLTQKAALTRCVDLSTKTIQYVQELKQELDQMVEDYQQQGKDILKNRTYTTKRLMLNELSQLLEFDSYA